MTEPIGKPKTMQDLLRELADTLEPWSARLLLREAADRLDARDDLQVYDQEAAENEASRLDQREQAIYEAGRSDGFAAGVDAGRNEAER